MSKFLINLVLLSTALSQAKASDDFPNIKSAAALVVDLKSNEVLFERDAEVLRPIASISKIFGAAVFLRECPVDLSKLHTMSVENREAARGGDKSKLITGWSYSSIDLLHAALMRSDNRALPALAEACGLSPAAFAHRMTQYARTLGLGKTWFKEPNGLSVENVSTPRELVVALREVLKFPLITNIMGKREYEIVGQKDGRERRIVIKNTDRLLSKNLAEILGGKTGYTDIARYCLAVAARTFEGRELGMVFLGAEGRHTRFADFTRIINWLAPSAAVAGRGVIRSHSDRVPYIEKKLVPPDEAETQDEQAANSTP